MHQSIRSFTTTLVLILFPLFLMAQEERQYYQLKIYNFENESQSKVTEEYLKDAYIPALKRKNIAEIGVFKPIADSINKLFVLVPFSSIEQLDKVEKELLEDVVYKKEGGDYLTASAKNPPYSRVEVILLSAFKHMPQMKPSPLTSAREKRIYELRSYQAPTEAYLHNKIEMFNEGGEIKLFDELGFNAVFYGEVIAGPHMPNLMYLTTFEDQESRDLHWKNFGDSPVWHKMSALEKYKDNVSHIDINFLYPTEYSDY